MRKILTKPKERGHHETKMAVVKSNFVKRGPSAKNRAKATIRYIQHRPGKDGDKIIRTLFNREGEMQRSDAYRMIDEAGKTDILFRFVISPDPNSEDKERDLDMRQITENTMLKLEEIVGKTIHWVGAIHADHTDKRHIHTAAISKRLLPRRSPFEGGWGLRIWYTWWVLAKRALCSRLS
jgi:hypothetical protein